MVDLKRSRINGGVWSSGFGIRGSEGVGGFPGIFAREQGVNITLRAAGKAVTTRILISFLGVPWRTFARGPEPFLVADFGVGLAGRLRRGLSLASESSSSFAKASEDELADKSSCLKAARMPRAKVRHGGLKFSFTRVPLG
jgi:hypothetical protein